MKFDVIVGNPPYQMSDGGNGASARPIYHLFVEQAKKLQPRYLTMIIPARWYTGGKGLDEFRSAMLGDKRIRKLVDYENYKDVFPGLGGLAGGVCYFLWVRDSNGDCEVTSVNGNSFQSVNRLLDEYPIFIRQNLAVDIVKKVTAQYKKFLNERVSSRKPFGLPTNYLSVKDGVPCWFIQRIGLGYARACDVVDSKGYLEKWKLLVPKAPIAGQTDFTQPVGLYYDGNMRISRPGECCTESWLIAGAFNTQNELVSYKSYLLSKIVRFLILQSVVSQDVTKKNYCFVPDLEKYFGEYTDEKLCKMWGITREEWAYIDSRIGEIGK
jgi:site-specific DNA-methyltransferase (adenine-specific)